MQSRWWLYLGTGMLVGGVLGLLVMIVLQSPVAVQSVAVPQVGKRAPDFELASLEGSIVKLSSLTGRPVLVNFWATWCLPCIEEMPNFQNAYEAYSRRFEILAVNANEPEKDVAQFVSDVGVSFPILLDPDGMAQSLYKLRGYPTTFFIDRAGTIIAIHIGLVTKAKLQDYLSELGVKP
jgi:thiol-disulfide isomerase/thioredoxin